MLEFQVNKANFTQSRVVEHHNLTPDSPLAENEIIVAVESFALTANNITYAVLGDQLNYWQFFPAVNIDGDKADYQWGIIPVWGFATVVSSNSNSIPVGEKLFGYFPPASLLKMTASKVNSQRFIDSSEHRATLAPGYNIYRRVANEQGYDQRFDEQRMLLFPLHITSYCLWDYLQDNNYFDAEQVIIISASSKTSIGLAYGLHQDDACSKVVGMTSARNTAFVNDLALYSQVVSYDEIAQLNANKKTVIVDMASNASLLKAIEKHLSGNLQYCIQVGLTHWDAAQAESPLVNTQSEMFFAPGHIQRRIAQWGPKEFEQRSLSYMSNTTQKSADWLTFTQVTGLDNMADYYSKVCEGSMPPEQGIIIKP